LTFLQAYCALVVTDRNLSNKMKVLLAERKTEVANLFTAHGPGLPDLRVRDVATGGMRIAAATFALERRFSPFITMERRVNPTEAIRAIRQKPIKGMRANLDARTLKSWREGSLKNDPSYLRSLCAANNAGVGVVGLLDANECKSTLQQHLRVVDVYAWKSSVKCGSATGDEKVRQALIALSRLERDWRVSAGPVGEGLLSLAARYGDTAPILALNKASLRVTVPESVFQWQAIREPQRVLQWLLRFALYLHESDFPIHRYAVDLATAFFATATLEKWDSTWQIDSNDQWAKLEALDATNRLFFGVGLSIRKAAYLLHRGHPWTDFVARCKAHYPNEVTVARNMRLIRNAYRAALRETGINPKSIAHLHDRTQSQVRAAEFGVVAPMDTETYLSYTVEKLREEMPSVKVTLSKRSLTLSSQ